MRTLFCFIVIWVCAGCSQENSAPPVIDIDMSQVDPEAIVIIASALQRATSAEDWLKLGKYYHAHGLTDTAIEAYTYSLVLKSKPETRYLLGMANATLGNYDQAIAAVSSIGSYVPALWRQGYWQLDLGNYALAETHFKTAIEKASATPAAIVGLSRAYLAQGQPEQAITTLENLIDRGGTHQYVIYLLGKAHQQAGNAEVATRLLQNTKSGQPKWNDPWFDEMRSHQRGFAADLNRAIALIDSGKLPSALLTLKKIETKYPFAADVQSNLATVQLQLGRADEAIKTLGQAIRVAPDYAPLQLTMAFALADVGEVDKAIGFANKALAIQPSMIAASSFIGKLAMQQQNYPLAFQSFTSSIQLGDTTPRTRELLAELHLRFGRWTDAVNHYSIVLQISPDRTGSIGGLVIALANNGEASRAFQLLNSSLQKFPNDQFLLQAQRALEQMNVP